METAVVDNALSHLGLPVSASEGHGLLCGLICARGFIECDAWVALMDEDNLERLISEDPDAPLHTDNPHVRDLNADGDGRLLQQLHRETLNEFGGGECDFYPLLPDDELSLMDRTDALAEWCQAFLFGLAAGGIKDFSQLPEQVEEICRDLIEFSQARHEGEEAEQDEFAYVELVEYIRVGVQLIFEELNSAGDAPSENKVLH